MWANLTIICEHILHIHSIICCLNKSIVRAWHLPPSSQTMSSFSHSMLSSELLVFFSPSFIITFSHSRVFHTSISLLSFTWVWVTASLLKYSGLFSVFRPILVIWMVSTCPLSSKTSSPFTNPLDIMLSAPCSVVFFLFFFLFTCEV